MKPVLNYPSLLFALIISCFTACRNDPGNESPEVGNYTADSQKNNLKEIPKEAIPLPAAGSIAGDTINIRGKFVMFFGPAEALSGSGNMSAETIQSFKSSGAALIDSLSVFPDIKAVYTTAGYFRIYNNDGGDMVISKRALKAEAGLLVSDGNQPPTIKKGVQSAAEYHKFIKNFFFLK